MKIINIFIKLKPKEGKKHECGFCGSFFNKNEATHLLRVSDLDANKTVDANYTCDDCKERIESKQIDNCADCGRLARPFSKKCLCVYIRENNLTFEIASEGNNDEYSPLELERQINTLNEEKEKLMEEVNTHLNALQVSELWHKKQKQELLDKITKLEEENKQLKEQNKKLTSEELAKEVTELKQQLARQTAQIEVPAKDKGIKGFFKALGSK